MGKKIYLECTSGISGDMFTAALLDLGADKNKLIEKLKGIPVEGFKVKISRVNKSGWNACDFAVILDREHENHDHDMEYLHGHRQCQEHKEREAEHRHTHEQRNLQAITELIEQSQLEQEEKNTAIRIFEILATGEAKAHGVSIQQVHFHEVGAVDSIVDILAAAICLWDLKIDEVIIPQLFDGTGTIRCQHGILSVPVPAVRNIAADNHLPLIVTETEGELVTPTGAAIAAAIRTEEELPEKYKVIRTGLGAGKRDYKTDGVLRAHLIEG